MKPAIERDPQAPHLAYKVHFQLSGMVWTTFSVQSMHVDTDGAVEPNL